MKRAVEAVDLFCGAGGTSSGLVAAGGDLKRPINLLAINHWDVAIATHEKNLPGVRHLCADVETVRPTEHITNGRLDLLVASPTCTHFSTARGGKPINDQKRADPWHVVRWASELRIENILIENVPEFRSWGPLGKNNRPIKKKKGQTFEAYLNTFRAMGYTVEHRVLNAADYGDPTTRRRLFIMCRLGKDIHWPEPTHAKPGSLLPGQKPWRAAREIIDWSIEGESIFGRKRGPLSKNTIARIIAGLQRFGGPELQPFLVVLRGTDPGHLASSAKPLELPLPSVCESTSHFAVAEPFLLSQQSGGAPRSVKDPMMTVAAKGAIGFVEPFIVGAGGPERAGKPKSVEDPLGTMLARNHKALVQPFIVPRYGERPGQTPRTHDVDAPLPTVPTTCQHMLVEPVVEPFVVHVNHGDNPPGSGRGNGGRIRSTEDPLPTVTASRRGLALVDAHLQKYYGTGVAKPVSEPVDTVTTKQRFGLVTFERGGLALDIRFRMLKPHELARAQGFGDDYQFTGNVEDQVRQIGNAVPRQLARALCRALLED